MFEYGSFSRQLLSVISVSLFFTLPLVIAACYIGDLVRQSRQKTEIEQEMNESKIKLFSGTPRDPARISTVLTEVEKIWKENPDLRLGQLIVILTKSDPFYVEDDVVLKRIKEFRNEQLQDNQR